MRTVRFFFHLISAFFSKFKGVLVFGIIIGILFFYLFRFLVPILFTGTTQTIGVSGRYRTDELPSFILQDISQGLTKLNSAGTAEPDLASSWETPDKGKTWIFKLHDNLYWQDGKKVTSKTIVYQFSDVDIETPDDQTIIFKLKEPFSPFPVVVSRPTFKTGLLGIGNWSVKKISIFGGFVEQLVIENDVKDKKIYKFFPTEERTKLAYKLGEVDKLISLYDPAPFNEWPTALVSSFADESQVATLFFNTQDKLLSEKSLRQALMYALKKDELGDSRAISPVSSSSWAYNSQVKQYSYDPEKAKDIVDNLPDTLKEDLTVKLVSTPLLLPTAEKIAIFWDAIGIKTEVLVSSVIPNEFQVFLTIFDIPRDPDQYTLWHSTQTTTNISNYASPRIDKLLEDGRATLESEERKKIYPDFQRFLLGDSPAGFLYHPMHFEISRK